MITNKSKIQYEIIVNEEEKEQIRDMVFKNGYQYSRHCEFIVPRPESMRWSILLTRKQYELFKRLWNETKKSRKGEKLWQ